MSCEEAALPFQAHANYEAWSIDFDYNEKNISLIYFSYRFSNLKANHGGMKIRGG